MALLGLIAGAAVFADLSSHPIGKYGLGVIVAFLGSAEIVFGFGRRAAQWRSVNEICEYLEVKLGALDPVTERALTKLQRRIAELPLPTERMYHTANHLAYIAAGHRLGCADEIAIEPIGFWRVWTRNILAGAPHN